MIEKATYASSSRRATIDVERIDTWLETSQNILNFPGVVELDDGRLLMSIHRTRHGAE